MGKLLRIAFACLKTGRKFDPAHHAVVQQSREQIPSTGESASSEPQSKTAAILKLGSVSAPVTPREAQRRRVATLSGTSVSPPAAGTGFPAPSGRCD
jgi:hypothetical protein